MEKRLFFFLERDDSSDEDEEIISNHITKANKGLYDRTWLGPDNVYSDHF